MQAIGTNRSHWMLVAGVIAVLAAPTAAQDAELVKLYQLTELTIEGGGNTRAYALNNTGQVIGYADVEGLRHSAHWHNEVATDLHGTVHFELQHPLFDQDYSEAFDISDADQVVGTARTAIKCAEETIIITNAFLLRPAVLTDLATPYPGDALTNLRTFGNLCIAYDSTATGISNANHVVGWADREDGSIRAFLVVPDSGDFYRDVLPPAEDDFDFDGDGVNDLMVDLGTLAGSDPVSSATAVNDFGQVTGYSYTIAANGRAGYHAFLITPLDTDDDTVGDTWFVGAGGVNTLMTDLRTLGGVNSWGRDVNNDGIVVGESDVATVDGEDLTHAFRWEDGTMFDLGTLNSDASEGFSAASAVNSDGIIVGWAENDERQRRAFVYEDGEMQDLNDLLYLFDDEGVAQFSSLVLTEARDINDDGSIVGWGTVGAGAGASTRGFLLSPIWVDPEELEEMQADTMNDDSEVNGGTGGDAFSSPLIPGTPGNLGTAAVTDGDPNQPQTAPVGALCGAAAPALLPLTLLGMICLRTRRVWS